MNFFLDENFPKQAQELLKSLGHTVFDIRGTPDEGVNDTELLRMAREKKAVLLTTDKDFFHSVPGLVPDHFGIVIIALRQPNKKSILKGLEEGLKQMESRRLWDSIFLVGETRIIIVPRESQNR